MKLERFSGLIERQLLLESFKRARASEISYVFYNPRDTSSTTVAKKVGMKAVDSQSDHLFIDLNTIEDLLDFVVCFF
jgi:hypothetical protein